MAWSDIGVLAELLGAIGVIASLIYLSRQVRQNTRAVAVVSATLLIGCATPPPPLRQDQEITTYYDRNHDGRVDFELHDTPGIADDAWALSDTNFDGRYDVRLKFGYVFARERMDKVVPRNQEITPSTPPVFTTE